MMAHSFPPAWGKMLFHFFDFARRLRRRGIKITPDRVIDAARSLESIDLSRREDFSMALKANLVSSKEDAVLFDELFESYWSAMQALPPDTADPEKVELRAEEIGDDEEITAVAEPQAALEDDDGDEESGRGEEYSSQEIFAAKDFSKFSPEEWEAADREFLRILARIVQRKSRRRELSAKGREIDFRRSFRQGLRYGGEFVNLLRRRRKIKPLKIIALCDVSGSMDPSTRFTLKFIFGLQRAFTRSEFFVFSTRLTRITDIVKRHQWTAALDRISQRARDWSGGTKIGESLQLLNRQFTRDLTAESAVVILVSDGWDRGEPELMDWEMKQLKRKARRLIWMNPLLGSPRYEPLSQGMRTALPYIDDFLPAGNLKGFRKLGRVLADLSH